MHPDRPTGMALDPAVAAALRAGLPAVSARTVATLTAEVAEYADPLRGELGANITRAVELALATFVHLAEEPAGEDPGVRLQVAGLVVGGDVAERVEAELERHGGGSTPASGTGPVLPA